MNYRLDVDGIDSEAIARSFGPADRMFDVVETASRTHQTLQSSRRWIV
jgi:hypothetical protein